MEDNVSNIKLVISEYFYGFKLSFALKEKLFLQFHSM